MDKCMDLAYEGLESKLDHKMILTPLKLGK